MGLIREDGTPKLSLEHFPAGLGICQWFHFEDHRLEQAGLGVGAEAQLPIGRPVVVQRLDPQRPLGRLDRIADESVGSTTEEILPFLERRNSQVR